jgi:RNA polymerase sigma-70 factor (family 1)
LDYSIHTDAELTAFFKAGDHDAFREVFNRYYPLLLNFAAKRSTELTEAEDAVQDVFVRIWEYREELQLFGNLGSYLHRAVANRLINLLKSQHTRGLYVEAFQKYLDEVVDDTDYRIRESQVQQIIEKEISALPPKMAEVFRLRNEKYLSNKEIADQLGISEQTVETHIKTALKRLRVRLGLFIYLMYLFY